MYGFSRKFLAEILNIKAEIPLKTTSVTCAYAKAISNFGSEFNILHPIPVEEIHHYPLKLSIAIARLEIMKKMLPPVTLASMAK